VTFVTQPILEQPGGLGRAEADLQPAAIDPDRELVERWRAGDGRAFDALVRRHERRIFGLLVRMLGDPEEAADATQDTFLNLHRHGHRFRSESRFSTFLYRVAVNAALNRRRSLGRRRAHMDRLAIRQAVGEALPQQPRDPEQAAVGEQLQARLQCEIDRLAASLRAPLVLYDIQGLPYAEIAEILGVAEGTVKSRIHRARKALRERLGDLVAAEASAP
jgi:RNA polymerase sigma-70 factor (ECF subfamily)